MTLEAVVTGRAAPEQIVVRTDQEDRLIRTAKVRRGLGHLVNGGQMILRVAEAKIVTDLFI